ncbi:hypothetical protein C8D87_10550 [Lentzea atacamensis]|uniref:DUF2690 domain-containing protein n=1 Tax=Lentzea atacamensis TaxID=531938 RepID=A0ABX9E5F4_9PSEU|nr:hypothetical protein [Lentzea atacamensis]RAS64563.1 hypothetical protein C8D87_10550 [Lentzea atacamensis]
MRKPIAIAAALAATLLSVGLGTANAAETVPGCASAKQIGTTGHLYYQGKIIASVKQFAGCGKNFPYTWVWDSYAQSNRYRVSNWIAVIENGEESPAGGGQASMKQELWGAGAATLDKCTRAVSSVTTPDGKYVSGWTDLRC